MADGLGQRHPYRGHGSRHRHTVCDEPVWRLVRHALGERVTAEGRESLDVLDAGGGTGSFAVPIAALGHRVTVIDPSPDSLAALERRAGEDAVTDRVRAVQAEAVELPRVVEPRSIDVVVCHNVLEVVDDPAGALAAMCQTTRPTARLSILATNRNAVVLGKVIAGHVEEARHALSDPDGRWGADDPLPRRFTLGQLHRLVRDVGLAVDASHGLHAFRDLAPAAAEELTAATTLLELEEAAEVHPAFQPIASQLHVLARWGSL